MPNQLRVFQSNTCSKRPKHDAWAFEIKLPPSQRSCILFLMWIILATAASALWGFSYALNEQIYKFTSIYTTIAINCLIVAAIFLMVSLKKGVLIADLNTIMSSQRTMLIFASGVVVFIFAELFISLSITQKNATFAGLIEISYPLFIALMAYFVFRETHLNWGIAVGALCIFLGVAIVYWFGK